MAAMARFIHPMSSIAWKPLSELAPDITIKHEQPVDATGNGHKEEPETSMGLAFIDPDGETHIYVFDTDGKQKLLAQLTGGIVIPGGPG